MAFSSYAPFIYYEHRFYIFISDIAKHSKNLQATKKASLFFIEDESKTQEIFARKRISLQCSSNIISKDEKKFEDVITVFKKKFSESMLNMLLGMSDFNLYELRTDNGEATFGFGEAYVIG